MFIRKTGKPGIEIALAHVVSAKHRDGGYVITDTQGEEHYVSDFDWKLAVETTVTSIIPAQPNTFLLERCGEEDGSESIIRQTVLAWGVYADGVVRPIVTDFENTLDSWAVEMPTGRVESSTITQWENAEAWLAGNAD